MLVILSLVIFCFCVVFIYCLEQLLFILRFIVQGISGEEPLFLELLISPISLELEYDSSQMDAMKSHHLRSLSVKLNGNADALNCL